MDLRFLVRSSLLLTLAGAAVACVSPVGSVPEVVKKTAAVCFSSDEVDCSYQGGLTSSDGAARVADVDEDCDDSGDDCDDE